MMKRMRQIYCALFFHRVQKRVCLRCGKGLTQIIMAFEDAEIVDWEDRWDPDL